VVGPIGGDLADQFGDFGVFDPKCGEMRCNARQIVVGRPEEARPGRKIANLIRTRNVSDNRARRMVGGEGQSPDRPNRCIGFYEDRMISVAGQLAPPEDFSLGLDISRKDAEDQPVAAWPMIQRSQKPRPFHRAPPADAVLQDEAAGMVGDMGPPKFGKAEGRVPHQRTIGEDPKIARMVRQGAPAKGLTLVRRGQKPFEPQFRATDGKAVGVELPECRLRRVGDQGPQLRVVDKGIVDHRSPMTGRVTTPNRPVPRGQPEIASTLDPGHEGCLVSVRMVQPPMRPLRGIALKLASVMVFIVMAAMIKATAAHVPAGEAVFFRSSFAIPVIVAWLAWRRELASGLKARSPIAHVWRGVVGTMAMGLGFAGLGYLPLPEVTAIGYAAPLLTVIFAAMFLGEEVRIFRISAVALGLTGVLIVLAPRLSLDPETAGMAEAFGAMLVLVRKLVMTEATSAIVFYFSLTATALSLVTLPFGWVWPAPWEAALLVGAGFLGGLGQILLTSSYREADASLIAPFDYASMLFALAIGYFVFAEVPTWPMLGGAALIVTAGCLIIWRERKLGLERARQRKAMTPQG
jgi:drug/metabolite transporter (DMT)-like permease